jgi:geranylgeranyl diphosphate synthase type II
LCVAVATALGDPQPKLTDAAGVAIELLHSASLVQDDLPCFDNAPTRRGRMALHQRYDEATAILVGDALIVLAFQTVAAHVADSPDAVAGILASLCTAAGAPAGIAAGQAWESEKHVDVAAYHHAKTAALFEAAAAAGAFSAGAPAEPWRRVGGLLGQAYQIADDVADQLGEASILGKPIHQDGIKSRPSIAHDQGTGKALVMLDHFVVDAVAAIPDCPGRNQIEEFLTETAMRLCPPHLRLVAKGQATNRA